MAFDIKMEEDGILRVYLEGDLTPGMVKSFKRQYAPYVQAATPEIPLKNMLFLQDLGKLSHPARKYLTALNQDPRYGFAAFVRPPRQVRVLGQFIQKATGRENIKFFNNENDALDWLKTTRKAHISSS